MVKTKYLKFVSGFEEEKNCSIKQDHNPLTNHIEIILSDEVNELQDNK